MFASLFFVLMLVALVCVPIGFLFPGLFKDKKTGVVPGRFSIAFSIFILSFIFGLIGIFTTTSEKDSGDNAVKADGEPAAIVKTEAKIDSVASAEPVAKLAPDGAKDLKALRKGCTPSGITPSQFRNGFNDSVSSVVPKLKLSKIAIDAGDVNDTFTIVSSGNSSLVGTVDKNTGSLCGVMVLVSGGGSKKDNAESIVVLFAASHAINPTIDKAKNSEIVSSIFGSAMKGFDSGQVVTKKVGKLDYSASANSVTGLIFSFGG